MKKILLLAILLWMTVFLTGSNVALAASPGRTISVTGHGELAVAPDMAYVTLGVMTSAGDAKTAMQENSRVVSQVVDALLAQGIAQEQIKTSLVSLYPIFPPAGPGPETNQTAVAGYRAQNNVTATVKDLASVGKVMDTALGAGANQMQGVRFAVSEDSKLRDEVLKKAILDGQHKAAVLAQSLGGKLGKVQTVSESGRPYPVYAANAMAKIDAGVPVYGGTLMYNVDVSMTYALE